MLPKELPKEDTEFYSKCLMLFKKNRSRHLPNCFYKEVQTFWNMTKKRKKKKSPLKLQLLFFYKTGVL